jgi:MerR family transcriptional regulator/heat shock protein HspR
VAVSDAAPAQRGVYGISVMSELSGVGPQTLRLYERRGLLTPARTGGGTRRYSEADLATLRRISALIADGINLTGIGVILDLETQNAVLAERIAQLAQMPAEGSSSELRPQSGDRSSA